MVHKRRLAVTFAAAGALAMVLALAGCEKPVREARVQPDVPAPDAAPAVTVASTTQRADPLPAAAAIRPESKPADIQPALAMLTVNGLGAQFPPTKLRVQPADGDKSLMVEMFSDLPKSALRKYDGNELYFEMIATAPDGSPTSKVEGSIWRFKAPNSEKTDSPNGIFLAGQTTHLQPFDVLVKFVRGDGPQAGVLMAEIMGQFRGFEAGTPNALAPFVAVNGRLPVELVPAR
jgi:hypothetical protein